jgi:hypothetical protein
LDVVHPAAKMVVMASQRQEEEVLISLIYLSIYAHTCSESHFQLFSIRREKKQENFVLDSGSV